MISCLLQAPAASGNGGLERLGMAADTLLQAERGREPESHAPLRSHHEPPQPLGMPSLGNLLETPDLVTDLHE